MASLPFSHLNIAGWCNGNIAVSFSADTGSIPATRTQKRTKDGERMTRTGYLILFYILGMLTSLFLADFVLFISYF